MILFGIGTALFLLEVWYLKNCPKRMRGIITNSIVALTSIILTLLLLEAGIRTVAPQKTLNQLRSESPPIYEQGENISWQLKPNSIGPHITGEFNVTYKINSLGMRDKERNLKKTKGITRILVLGDSFTFGFGVNDNETYPYFLEKILDNKIKKFEVWNAGVSGYAPDTEYVYLKNNIGKIKPDIVLLGFYAGNDVLDLCKNYWQTGEKGLPKEVESKIVYVEENKLRLKNNQINPYKSGFVNYIRLFLSRFSHSFLFLKNKLAGTSKIDVEGLPLLLVETNPAIKIKFDKTKELIDAMQKLSKENNASFVMIIIPARMQVNNKEWSAIEKTFEGIELKRNKTQEDLLLFCKKYQIECVNLMPAFLSNASLYHTLTDIHLNKDGHLKTAQSVAEFINKRVSS